MPSLSKKTRSFSGWKNEENRNKTSYMKKKSKKLYISRTNCDILVLRIDIKYKENQEISIQKSKLPDELYYFVQH